ncbi:MAG: LysR family transcriptional regulator [Eubacterium sp.]|nr:LysR family transcriptional regulator [Eubacterium sp.]
MTIQQLKSFVTVAKYCNYREAAEKLFVSQQALHKQIKNLEQEIDILLFENNKQRITLTKAGEYLYLELSRLLKQMEQKINTARMMGPIRQLRIGIPQINETEDKSLAAAEEITRRYSSTETQVITCNINELVSKFEADDIDIAIMFAVDLYMIRCDFQSMMLKELPYGVICSTQHLLAHRKVLTRKELLKETLFVFNDLFARNVGKSVINDFTKEVGKPKDIKEFDNWKNMELELRRNKGVAITFEAFMPLGSKELKFIPFAETSNVDGNRLVVVWKDTAVTPFAEIIKEYYK